MVVDIWLVAPLITVTLSLVKLATYTVLVAGFTAIAVGRMADGSVIVWTVESKGSKTDMLLLPLFATYTLPVAGFTAIAAGARAFASLIVETALVTPSITVTLLLVEFATSILLAT